jgi:hypothetical protein
MECAAGWSVIIAGNPERPRLAKSNVSLRENRKLVVHRSRVK